MVSETPGEVDVAVMAPNEVLTVKAIKNSRRVKIKWVGLKEAYFWSNKANAVPEMT